MRRYVAVVFRHVPPSPDFSQSDQVVLPGDHTEVDAWKAVYAVLGGADGHQYIGGTIEPCACVLH